jgi:hypothetical protein
LEVNLKAAKDNHTRKLKYLLPFAIGAAISLLIAPKSVGKQPNDYEPKIESPDIPRPAEPGGRDNPVQDTKETDTPARSPLPKPQVGSGTLPRAYTKEEVKDLIIRYSNEYGIDPVLPTRIATCESKLKYDAKNPHSSASGIFQYLAGSTWRNTPEGKQGLSPFDADANVRAAVRHIAVHGTAAWNPSKHCWSKS